MKNVIIVRSNYALAGFALVLATAVSGSATVLNVPADYSTIQAAVDAAGSGDEIQIAAGVYTNQVVVTNKSLRLSGSPGAVLRATPGMEQTLTAYGLSDVALLAVALSDVVVSGLTFEGERLADSQSSLFDGICFVGSSGSVEDCRVIGFRGANLGTTYPWPTGIDAANAVDLGTGVVNLQVLRSTFADNAVSIWLTGDYGEEFDPNLLRLTFKVNDNTIVGNGPDATGRQFGITIWAGAGGEVKRNTITEHAYVGTTAANRYSHGILAIDNINFSFQAPLAALQPMEFEGNIFRNTQVALTLVRGDGSTIVNNSFEGRSPGYRPSGVLLSGENVLVATNRFNDMQTGIVLLGNDPDYGTYLGIASNATLVANGFCDVDTNYNLEPLTTYEIQSTLTCPWPTLNIRAILLSWPYSYNGYSVETAADANGPWTPSGGTIFLQNEQHNVAMPMDSDQQFFRLSRP